VILYTSEDFEENVPASFQKFVFVLSDVIRTHYSLCMVSLLFTVSSIIHRASCNMRSKLLHMRSKLFHVVNGHTLFYLIKNFDLIHQVVDPRHETS
jgi:hypothetical protein